MTDYGASINGLYPVEYFHLAGAKGQGEDKNNYWASTPRYDQVSVSNPNVYDPNGEPTAEFIEFDLGRVRQVNYINIDTLLSPVIIEIHYDAISNGRDFKWVPVTRGAKFDDRLMYDAKQRNPWVNSDFYFTDEHGEVINTRYLRVKYSRRHHEWPAKGSGKFPWSIVVKSMRAARLTAGYSDTRGLLFDSTSEYDATTLRSISGEESSRTRAVRQRFRIPESTPRGGYLPDLMGVSFLVNIEGGTDGTMARFQWSIRDGDRVVARGLSRPTGVTSGTDFPTEQAAWVNCYIRDTYEALEVGREYTVGFECLDPNISHSVHLVNPNRLPANRLNGTFTFTGGSSTISFSGAADPRDTISVGDYVRATSDVTRPSMQVASMTYNAGTLTGSITLSSVYSGVTESSDGLDLMYPVEIPPKTQRTGPDFTVTSAGSTITYDGETNLRSILKVGDMVRLAGASDQSFLTVTQVTSDELTVSAPYAGVTGSGVRLETIIDEGDDSQSCLAMRVWASVSDEGEDVLGNAYRHVSVRSKAEYVNDGTSLGWISAPQPDPRAIECLYLDARDAIGLPQTIDSIRVAPLTSGVLMNVYSTMEGGTEGAPRTRDEWDHLRWHPLGTYQLNGSSTFALEGQRSARFIKLEFTNLKPMRFTIPSSPELPAQTYYRHPTWVEQLYYDPAYDGYQRVVEDWFTRSGHSYHQALLASLIDVEDPAEVFSYKQRLFFVAVARDELDLQARRDAGKFIDIDERSLVDPVTKSKIRLRSTNSFSEPLTAVVDASTLLGRVVSSGFNPQSRGDAVEGSSTYPSALRSDVVSTSGGSRIELSYAMLANSTARFDIPCLHLYRVSKAKFNGKAYFAGMREVELLRIDPTEVHDNNIIEESFGDLSMTVHSDLEYDEGSDIPAPEVDVSGSFIPNVFATYQCGSTLVQDEPLALNDFNTVALSVEGAPAEGIILRAGTTAGSREYAREVDYSVTFSLNAVGEVVTNLSRARGQGRLVIPRGDTGISRDDGAVVTMRALISGSEEAE